jgi:hypothetical protein
VVVTLAGIQFHTGSIRGDEGKGTGYVVLGTDVADVGFNLLEPRLELGSRVVGDVDILGIVVYVVL